MKGFLFTMLLVLAVVAIACSSPTPVPPTIVPTLPQPTLAAPTVPAPTLEAAPPTLQATQPTPAPEFDLGETKTYRDTVAGFEFDYPATWNMTPVSDEIKKSSIIYAATFYSWEPKSVSAEGIPAGETKIDVGVYNKAATSPEAALEFRKQEFANSDLGHTILSEQAVTLPSGLKATRLQVKDRFGESSELITALNGNMILFGGVGDYALLDAIGRTLRPI